MVKLLVASTFLFLFSTASLADPYVTWYIVVGVSKAGNPAFHGSFSYTKKTFETERACKEWVTTDEFITAITELQKRLTNEGSKIDALECIDVEVPHA